MNDKVKAWVEKTPAEKINVCFAYNEDTQEIILTKDGVINRIDVSTLIAHNEKDDTETIFIPRNATNGDVIKSVFPSIDFTEMAFTVHATTSVTSNGVKGGISYDFWKDWWNAPFKTEREE